MTRLLVAIDCGQLSMDDRGAVLRMIVDYARQEPAFDELRIDSRPLVDEMPSAVQQAISDLASKATSFDRGQLLILRPTEADIRNAEIVAPYVIDVSVRRGGEEVVGTGDQIDEVNFVANSRADLTALIRRLESELAGSWKHDIAELSG